MWLATTRGFYSAVAHRDKPDTMLVRARTEEDIRALTPLLEQYVGPWSDSEADYLWRVECSSESWASACAYLALDIPYDNFKSAVESPKHRRAYMQCWEALAVALQGVLFPGWGEHFIDRGEEDLTL